MVLKSVACFVILLALICLAGSVASVPSSFSQSESELLQWAHELPSPVRSALGWTSARCILQHVRCLRHEYWADLFCGTGGIGAAFSRRGFRGRWLDLAVSSSHDILTAEGYAAMICAVLALVPFGFCWLGPPCSLFIWRSSGTTKRSHQRPRGNLRLRIVRSANRIAARVLQLLKLCTLRRVQWVVEQPMTSMIFMLPRWQQWLSTRPCIGQLAAVRHFCWLGHWGHSIPKPTVLWGCAACIAHLHSAKPKQTSNSVVRRTSLKWVLVNKRWVQRYRISGIKKKLKASQEYPRAFCDAVATHTANSFRRARQLCQQGLL